MGKTAETMEIEDALYRYTKANGLGVYGCFEVTVGDVYGTERVDFMTMDSKENFRCYEIKVSKSDFSSKSKLTFLGDFNYLVIPKKLIEEIKDMDRYKSLMWSGIGILTYYDGGGIQVERKAKNKAISIAQRCNLMHCMVRSLSRYCKYEIE
jgi:hypothetical protein